MHTDLKWVDMTDGILSKGTNIIENSFRIANIK